MDKVFLDYDREALDKEYFIRGRVPEWDDKVIEFQGWSAARRSAGGCWIDLPYGSGDRRNLDIFEAKGQGPSPVLVFVHGGYWRMLEKSDFSYVAHGFEAHGIVTVIVNYGLLPDRDLSGMVEDVRLAMRWIARNISAMGGDADRIFLCGHSAGAQLAGLAAATDWSAAEGALPRNLVKGYVGISGVYDLRPVQQCFLNDIGFLDDESVARFGADAIRPGTPCGGLFAYGGAEGVEFARQSREQAAIWTAAGGKADLIELPSLNHATTVEQLRLPDSALCQRIRAMMLS